MKKRYLLGGASALAVGGVVAKLLSRPNDVLWSECAKELIHAEDSYFVTVDGIRIHYQEAGPENGPVVFLIHGFCASNQVWSDVFLPLARAGFRVIAPDLVGFGFSEKPSNADYTIDMQARVVIHLMDRLGVTQASLMGSSYGGAVAVTCALDYANRVRSLVLVGAVINDESTKQPLLRLAALPLLGNVISPFMLDSRALVRWRMARIYSPENAYLMTEERLRSRHRPLRTASTHRAVVKTLRNWRANRIQNEAAGITQPTLLIWGDSDKDTPVENGEVLRQAILNSRLFVFKNCGHLPQEEYPSRFLELVVPFLSARSSNIGEQEPLADRIEDKLKLEAKTSVG